MKHVLTIVPAIDDVIDQTLIDWSQRARHSDKLNDPAGFVKNSSDPFSVLNSFLLLTKKAKLLTSECQGS